MSEEPKKLRFTQSQKLSRGVGVSITLYSWLHTRTMIQNIFLNGVSLFVGEATFGFLFGISDDASLSKRVGQTVISSLI